MVSSSNWPYTGHGTKPENIYKAYMNMMSKAKFRKTPYEEIKVSARK
jgi:hypothetical protein